MQTFSHKAYGLRGVIAVPGDKSISHRSLIFASQAIGTSKINGLLESEDVIHTAEALQKMGVQIEKNGAQWVVQGVGVGGLSEPSDVLYMGNSGTGARLMMGLVSSYPFTSFFSGDASLSKRPMKRVIGPLSQSGAEFKTHEGNRLPLSVTGLSYALPMNYTLPVASAQVKSAILLATLNIAGETRVVEPIATRDHTERMMRSLGVNIKKEGDVITMQGQPELSAFELDVPSDPSSAAFPIVAALITPGSELTVTNICMNPLRTGLYDTLLEMGADITFSNQRIVAGEDVADITARTSQLKGVKVPASRAPSMIDEYPILSVAASVAEGESIMEGLEELRVKESDRLQAISDALTENKVTHQVSGDSLTIAGGGVEGGGMVKTHLDHRIAMSYLVMGMAAQNKIAVDDVETINTSFPGFISLMNGVGADVK